MPPRKPFRSDKNRDRGRAQHGSGDTESSSNRVHRDNRSQEKKKSWGQKRPRSDERAASPRSRYGAESEDSKPRRERPDSRDETQPGYKATGGSYWIYGNHAVLAAI